MGCALVDRANKALPPTPEGQVVLQHARRLLQGAVQLSNVRCGVVVSRSGYRLSPAARAMIETLIELDAPSRPSARSLG